MVRIVLTDEEVERLGTLYQRIKRTRVLEQRWDTFKKFVDDYLNDRGASLLDRRNQWLSGRLKLRPRSLP
jgi:hypothetical protein